LRKVNLSHNISENVKVSDTIDEISHPNLSMGLDLIQLAILLRLLRIFSFLNELEQWTFFTKALKVMRGPFANLVSALYSLYFLYIIIGIEIFGGKINTDVFIELLELNPDSEIGGDYIWLNFNDYWSGFNTLFSMQLFNNW